MGTCKALLSEDLNDFDDQDHMDYAGEFTFRVNETCLSSDHNIFMVAPTDTDAHNPILVHLKPSDMQWGEKQKYGPFEMKKRRKTERQYNKRTRGEPGKMMIRARGKIGATGHSKAMAGATGHNAATVDLQLHRLDPQEHGDQSECILL